MLGPSLDRLIAGGCQPAAIGRNRRIIPVTENRTEPGLGACGDNVHLAQLQAGARAAHAGLWSQPDPIAPWDYRYPEKAANLVKEPMSVVETPEA